MGAQFGRYSETDLSVQVYLDAKDLGNSAILDFG